MQSILWCKMKRLGTKQKFPIFPAAEGTAKILLLRWGVNAVLRVYPGGVPIISLSCLALLVTRMGGRLVLMYRCRQGKQTSPETVKNRWRQTCSGSNTGRSFKASWWWDVHAGYLVTGVFFFPLHILTNRQQKSWFLCFLFFFPAAGQWYTFAERDIPTAGTTRRMPGWPASILSPSAFLQMALKAGWVYFPEETKTHPDPPLEINAFPKDFIRIFFREWGRIRTVFEVSTEFVTLLLLYIFGFLTVRHVASQLPGAGIKLTPRPPSTEKGEVLTTGPPGMGWGEPQDILKSIVI